MARIWKHVPHAAGLTAPRGVQGVCASRGPARQPLPPLVCSNGCCPVSSPDTRRSPMRRWTQAAAVVLLLGATTTGTTQAPAPQPGDAKLPAPGTRGNADNVPYIGKSDPKGNPVRLARATGHVSNYTEEKVPAYTLPDPLVLANGQRVTSAEMWVKQRRPEILKFDQTEIYGRIPDRDPKVAWQVTEADKNAREGTAVLRRVVGKMGDQPDGPRMILTIYTPAKADKPVPLLLSITFGFPGGRG